MFDRLRRKKEAVREPHYADGKRMYAIGDIHGRADLLRQLHAQIQADAASYNGQCQVLYIGDFVDRGEQSSEVIDILLDSPLAGFEAVHLLGNHEQAMLDFLTDPLAMSGWLAWGGQSTLRSYGIHSSPMPSKEELQQLRDRLEEALPKAHLDFLKSCSPAYAAGDYYFVHAGIRPGVPLEKQAFEDQLWIRDPFLGSKRNHGAVIVHGHSINEEVELLPNRIGIDTGACYTGVLTSLVLEGTEQRLIQTGESR